MRQEFIRPLGHADFMGTGMILFEKGRKSVFRGSIGLKAEFAKKAVGATFYEFRE
jgi:hypothetical protein